jgi:predicted LPLAT superfamily acyltransferase
MDSPDRQRLTSLIESGKGCLLIGSHFGNLEYARGIASQHPDLVVNILIHDKHAANFAALMNESAPQSRTNLIQVTELDIDMSIRLKHKVDAGEWLLIAGDRLPVGTGDNVCAAEFLGNAANFPIGPFVLARLLQCPVYLMHCYLLDGQYVLRFDQFAECVKPSRVSGRVSYAREVQQFAAALESEIIRAPLQWFNFYDFWNELSGEASTGSAGVEVLARIQSDK